MISKNGGNVHERSKKTESTPDFLLLYRGNLPDSFQCLARPLIMERQIKEVDYGTFMTMTDNKQIDEVEIDAQENLIYFTDKDDKIYKTAMVEDNGLTQRLHDAGISFSGQEIRQSSPILTVLLSWILRSLSLCSSVSICPRR